jgi:hypothetical protein
MGSMKYTGKLSMCEIAGTKKMNARAALSNMIDLTVSLDLKLMASVLFIILWGFY